MSEDLKPPSREAIEMALRVEALPPASRAQFLRTMELLSAELKAPVKPFTTAYNKIMDDQTLSTYEKVEQTNRLLDSLPS